MRIRTLFVLALLWLAFCGFFPLPLIVAGLGFGAGMSLTGESLRVKPWVKPNQILFGKAVDRTSLNWTLVALESQDRETALRRMRAGFQPEGGVFAVTLLTDGNFAYVFNFDVAWD